MKALHRQDLFAWSDFDEARNLDFNSILWVRDAGNIAIDPLPQSAHDREHLLSLGPLRWIVVTNSDHTRDAEALSATTGAQIAGPAGERGVFRADRWLTDGEEIVPGLVALELHGSKTPGELALLLEEHTLITGDLIRCHQGGQLHLLPAPKLRDAEAATRSVRRLASLPVQAVLVGDGYPVFRGGRALLHRLLPTATPGDGASPLRGACLCGDVAFAIKPPTEMFSHCHCASCRRSHGAAFVSWVSVVHDRFQVVKGEARVHRYASSPGIHWSFCSGCGSPLFQTTRHSPDLIYVSAALVEPPLDREPTCHVSFDERVPWLEVADDLPKHAEKTSDLLA